MFVLPDNVEELFEEAPDYIIDAYREGDGKTGDCGAGTKEGDPSDQQHGNRQQIYPELFEITDLSKTTMCPLCKVMRRELKARGIRGIRKCCIHRKKPIDTSGSETGEDKGMRRALPGSISFVPPVAGLSIAGEVIREISEV